MIKHSFEFYGLAAFGIILIRYFVLAGAAHLLLNGLFYRPAKNSNSPQKALTQWRTIGQDIQLSILSSIIFALSAATMMGAYELGITKLYTDIHQYPLWYLGLSYILAIVLQDTYFYFFHRLFHHPRLFRWCHQGHHRSGHPTPWTSFAFDVPEAIVQALFLVGLVLVLPLHFITVFAVLTTMTIWAVVNHLGDRLPHKFPHHWCGRWFIGPAHHNIHHRQYSLHYGLYFTFWDRVLGTQAAKYDQELTKALRDSSLHQQNR